MTFINKDFRVTAKTERHVRLRWLLFAVGSAVLGVVIANTSSIEPEPDALPGFAETVTSSEEIARQSFELSLPELQARQEIIDEINQAPPREWKEFKVKSGDSLARLFKRAGIKAAALDEMMKSGGVVKKLKRIYPNDVIRVLKDDAGNLQALRYEIDHATYLLVERQNGTLEARELKHDIEKRITHASGEIESSLFLAAEAAGISQNLIMELAGIFGWDIDFVLDIRKGDKFTVVYEELYRNGEKIDDGNIISAEFINRDKAYQAVRYTNPQTNVSSYYTPEGRSMRKAFLRSPVDFTRISSKFSHARKHPILHTTRAHRGVDYAASRGTPVKAAGDGKIIHRAKKGGYGKTVIIQHGTKYSTLYAHLNNYNRKAKNGSRVKQGQVIGYVGSTGTATGPHLHYEFRVNGVHRNPLTVKLPKAEPIPERYRADFELMTAPKLAQLELLTRTQVALNN